MVRTRQRRFLGGAVLAAAFLAAAPVRAQICGDANDDGSVTLTDGVQILRAAAALPSTCASGACDVNGDGSVTLTDGVNVLRFAAGLGATLTCGTEIGTFVTSVHSEDDKAILDLGLAPVPGPGAPMTVGDPEGPTAAPPGGSNEVAVPFDTGGEAFAAQAGGSTLVVAVSDGESEEFVPGFFELPLPAGAGEIVLTINYPNDLGPDSFALAFATRTDGVLSEYRFLAQVPTGATQTPTATATPTPTPTLTPTPTPTPFCGNGIVEPPEECDPPQGTSPQCGSLTCNPNCTCQTLS